MIILRRLAAGFIALVTFFITLDGKPLADSYDPESFPQIAIEERIPETVRIMSFNIRNSDVKGVPMVARIPNVVSVINEAKPDSVGMQEATPFWTAALDIMLDGYARVGGGLGKYSVIYYNKDVYELVEKDDFFLSETPDKFSKGWDANYYRNCCWAKLRNKVTGEEYVHVNSHYDHQSETAKLNEALMVTAMMKEKFTDIPMVFTADLNDSRSSKAYEIMTENMKDSALEAEDVEFFSTYHACNPQLLDRRIIDFVLFSDGFKALKYKTVTCGYKGRFVSDHFPVYADLKFVD